MASIVQRGNRFRALVRRKGHTKCETFATKAAAKLWAARVESEVEQLRSGGVMQARGQTLGDLVDRYIRELYPAKRWGKSKSADLDRLKRELGDIAADKLTSALIVDSFRERNAQGAGKVVIAGQLGYLTDVLRVARTVWHLDVSVQAAQDARSALKHIGLVGKSRERDRRVSDAEVAQIIEHVESRQTLVPYGDIIRFLLASAMRISEVTRLQWADLDEVNRVIIVRDRKDPRAKVGNDQVIPLTDRCGLDAFQVLMRQPRDNGPRVFPYSEKTICSVFPRIVERLGLADLHLHDLRHEAISRLFESGLQIHEVAAISGHKSWTMLKRYTHVRATSLHRVPVARAAA
jgi:integrase